MVYLFIQPSKFKIMSFEYAIGNPLVVYETEFELSLKQTIWIFISVLILPGTAMLY